MRITRIPQLESGAAVQRGQDRSPAVVGLLAGSTQKAM
jgi:hypothetical protein